MTRGLDYREAISQLATKFDISGRFTREVISRLDEIVSEVEVADIPDANGQKGYVYKDAIELYQKIIKRLNK
ncbi:hypothetical protein J4229_03950 [Candidatus Pacearchaeota archaeon]|nr:hypothetical protein [Candidatus Pacearchaeota archaeon]